MRYSGFIFLFAYIAGRCYEAESWWGFGIALAAGYATYLYQWRQYNKLVVKPIGELRDVVETWRTDAN